MNALHLARVPRWVFAALLCAMMLASPALAMDDDEVADVESDETKALLKQLTIGMASEVVDERTFLIRDTSKGSKKQVHIRLGNTGAPAKEELDDGEYAEKTRVAKEALNKLVDKQMIWYKAAPDELQPPAPEDAAEPTIILADVWSIDGKHLSSVLKKEGHLSHSEEYQSDLGKDILTAAAEEEKKDSYKKLEEALKESEKAKQEAAKAAAREAAAAQEADSVEGFGISGWLGLAVVGVLALGVATNFGRESKKRVNLNRKKGALERFWMKLKMMYSL